MQRGARGTLACLACLSALLLTGTATAQDQDNKPEAKARQHASLDEAIRQNLRGIIDHGATLYNSGDWNGCYRLWEGTVMAMRPVLGERRLHAWAKPVEKDAASAAILLEAQKELQTQLGDRPQLKDVIEKGLDNARQTPQLFRRAFVLRVVLDQLRAETTSAEAARPKTKPDTSAKPIVTPETKKNTLWERLGGEDGVTHIVDDFVNLAAKDPKVDFFRHNKLKLDAEHVVKMKREIVEQISQSAGGPLKYSGPDMKKVHRDMGITNEQLDAAIVDLKKALEKNKVSAEDRKKVLDAVEHYRTEIVQPKKPEQNKPEEKKPVEKKPEEKKPVEKKPEEKKPEEKKPVEKKSEEKKPAASANVSGKVTYKGQPVAGAKISLGSADGKTVSGTTTAEGTYQLAAKPGEYKVTVSGPAKLALPAKYADANTSALKLILREGKQLHDINLQ